MSLDLAGLSHNRRAAELRALDDACTRPKVLVLGIGNILLGDEGVGVRVAERLQNLDPPPAASSFVDGGTLSFSLLAHLEDVDSLLIIDAAELKATPGTVCVFEDGAMDRFLMSSRRRSVHEVGLCDLLDMARLHGCLPPRRALVCIQPGNIIWSESLSSRVAEALPVACAEASSLLARWSKT